MQFLADFCVDPQLSWTLKTPCGYINYVVQQFSEQCIFYPEEFTIKDVDGTFRVFLKDIKILVYGHLLGKEINYLKHAILLPLL